MALESSTTKTASKKTAAKKAAKKATKKAAKTATKKIKAILKDSASELPPGYVLRREIIDHLGTDISQNKFSYAARYNLLGPYYAVGNVGYYSLDRAIALWGSAAQKSGLSRREASNAKKVSKVGRRTGPVETPEHESPHLRLLKLEEVATTIGRTVLELRELIDQDSFIPPTAELSDGVALWPLANIQEWSRRNPPPSPTMTFDGDTVRLDRVVMPGVYKLVREGDAPAVTS